VIVVNRAEAFRVIVVLAASLMGASCKRSEHSSATVPRHEEAAPVEDPVEQDEFAVVDRASSVADAVHLTAPLMRDGTDSHSEGTLRFAYWMARHGSFADVFTAKNETSYALVGKDSEQERGKRMCVSGFLVQINKGAIHDTKLFDGILETWGGKLFFFFAAKDTGVLVEKSSAKFCGVVTSMFHYSNSGGGTGHTVELVGMFDLPGNRPSEPPKPKAAKRSQLEADAVPGTVLP
jgi:hypothetical protein